MTSAIPDVVDVDDREVRMPPTRLGGHGLMLRLIGEARRRENGCHSCLATTAEFGGPLMLVEVKLRPEEPAGDEQ